MDEKTWNKMSQKEREDYTDGIDGSFYIMAGSAILIGLIFKFFGWLS